MAIDTVLTTNLFMRAIFGEEYVMPIASIIATMAMPTGLKVAIASRTAVPKVSATKAQACLLETRPEGIGLFFPLALSSSASARSFRMYVPAVMSSEAKGRARVLPTTAKDSGPDDNNALNAPGKEKNPVTVARQ
jgi:hypothetical protein